jgi:hypothetical protein
MRIPIIYGIITSILISIWMLAGYYFKWYAIDFRNLWLLIPNLIQIASLFLGIKIFKDKKFNGEISYLNSLYSGLVMTFIIAIVYTIFTFIYFNNSGDEMLNFYLAENKRILTEMKSPLTEINKNSKIITDTLAPSNQAKSAFIEKFIIGLFFSLVFATILRKRNNEPVK